MALNTSNSNERRKADSTDSNWNVVINGVCAFCGQPLVYTKHSWWTHSSSTPCINTTPLLHTYEPTAMGYAHGIIGATSEQNPFFPGGPLYDGVDSQGEALAWYNGWRRSQMELGKPIPGEGSKDSASPDGFDWLENERG